jgi:mannose/cellobiose epimerase-like protein (N-acyl-D-glucosamine 2-epimerase family)
MVIARSPARRTLKSLSDELLRWLNEDALPLWDAHGVDRDFGGYHEALVVDPLSRRIVSVGAIRRGRVVARQIFVFEAGARLGWQSSRSDPMRHGCDYLFSRLHRGDGLFHTSVDGLTYAADGQFSLYETAFYLFALARMHPSLGAEYPSAETALACLSRLRDGWGKANGGFEESIPVSLPLKSNPHMHLLEAALAWIAVAEMPYRTAWIDLARELVDLCCSRFIDPETHAIQEYYDAKWCPLPERTARTVEPGHQFEWAWLLMQWATSAYCEEAYRAKYRDAARRLIDLGESKGVDPERGVVINELWSDLTPKNAAAKLWPQTERLKAWCARLECARTAEEAQTARLKISAAVKGLAGYFDRNPAGMWHELLLADGTFAPEPCKASSLYHIVCAIETLHRTSSIRGDDAF